MEKVRQAEKGDLETIKKLWKEAFLDTDSFINWNFENNYSQENTFVLECDGDIASVVQIIPHTLVAKGKDLSVAYIWGLLTKEKYQGKGYARKILEYLFLELYKRGYDLSILTSAVGNMYEKFGYIKVCDAKRFKEPSTYNTVRLDDKKEIINFLDKIYNKFVLDKKIYMKRDMAYWNRVLEDITYASKGEVAITDKGYALLYPEEWGYVTGEAIGDFENIEVIDSMPVMARSINEKVEEIFNEEEIYIKFPL